MAHDTGLAGQALAAAQSVLAARGRELAGADRELSEIVAGAYVTATGAIRRVEEIHSHIDSATADAGLGTAAQGREFARFLLGMQRELVDVVTAAKADATAKVAALQELQARYQ